MKQPTSWIASASARRPSICRQSMTAQHSNLPTRIAPNCKRKAASPIGASSLTITVEWNDLIRGPSHIDTASLSDPVLIREDGSYLYTFCSVVDDIEFGITHVIRGEDHVVNAAVQIEITKALGGTVPPMGTTAF